MTNYNFSNNFEISELCYGDKIGWCGGATECNENNHAPAVYRYYFLHIHFASTFITFITYFIPLTINNYLIGVYYY